MAKQKPAEIIAADDAATTVKLRCENLGKTKDFTPAHAHALQALQDSRGITGDDAWLPVAADASDSSN